METQLAGSLYVDASHVVNGTDRTAERARITHASGDLGCLLEEALSRRIMTAGKVTGHSEAVEDYVSRMHAIDNSTVDGAAKSVCRTRVCDERGVPHDLMRLLHVIAGLQALGGCIA